MIQFHVGLRIILLYRRLREMKIREIARLCIIPYTIFILL